jgi:acyl-CoA thioester hydrolase
MSSFVATRRVEFRDTDAAGIMHFAAFFPLMESVEHEFLRHLGLSVLTSDETGPVSWPRVHADCDYRAAARFEDVLTVSLAIARLGEKSVTYRFEIRHDEQLVAEGKITAVCCRLLPARPPQSISIPAAIAEKLQPFVA